MSVIVREACGSGGPCAVLGTLVSETSTRYIYRAEEGLFYVRRHTCADGSFEWYVLNGHTRRRASRTYPTRAAAAAARRKLH